MHRSILKRIRASISIKVTAAILAVAAPSLLIVGHVAYWDSVHRTLRERRQDQVRLATVLAARTDDALTRTVETLDSIRELPSLNAYAQNRREHRWTEADADLTRVGEFLEHQKHQTPAWIRLRITGLDGKPILDFTPNRLTTLPTQTAFSDSPSTGAASVSVPTRLMAGPAGEDALTLTQALGSGKPHWGQIKLTIRMSTFLRSVIPHGSGFDGSLGVYSDDGRFLGAIGLPKPPKPILDAPLNGATNRVRSDNGQWFLISSRQTGSTPWRIVTEVPEPGIGAPLTRDRWRLIGLIGLVIVVDAFVILFLIRATVDTPLLRLLEKSRGILAEDPSLPLPATASDGFDRLSQSLHRIAAAADQAVETGRRQAAALTDQNKLLQTLIDAIPTPIFYKDTGGVYLGCNRAFSDFIGLPTAAIVGKTVFDISPPNLARTYQDADDALFASRGEQAYEASVRYADGAIHQIMFHKAVFYRGDTLAGLIGTMLDVTDRIAAQEQTRRSYDIQYGINQLLTMALTALDFSELMERFIDIVTGIAWLGIERKGAVFLSKGTSGPLAITHHWNLDPEILSTCAELPMGRCVCGRAAETRMLVFTDAADARHEIHPPGISPHGHYCVPILSSGNRLLGVLTLYVAPDAKRDEKVAEFLTSAAHVLAVIIERKQAGERRGDLEEQLRQAQKMEAIGALASGIAHDFNNLLQGIAGYTQLLLEAPDPVPEHREPLQRIAGAAERATALVRNLLTFSRKEKTELRPVDLNREIREAVSLLECTIPKMIRIETDLADDLKPVKGDSNQLGQVLVNLGTNARDAMPDGGRLRIATENVSLNADYCREHIDAVPGDYVRLTVSDTGVGMSVDVQRRIFDPFFTTKEAGQGTGLGLSMIYGVVKGHGGHITCSSTPGRGTTFSVHLPVAAMAEKESLPTDRSDQPVTGGWETILVIDDEKFICDMAQAALERFGYTVRTAESGESGLAIYRESGTAIELVLLDLSMPGMGGRRCMERLQKMDPAVRVIVASGYAAEDQIKSIMAEGASGFLRKPYKINELASTVRSVLDAGVS